MTGDRWPVKETPPVVRDGGKAGDVQHQGGVQRARLGRLALRRGGALVAQHPRPRHPPQLGALARLLVEGTQPEVRAERVGD